MSQALKMRIAPSVPLRLELQSHDGSREVKNFLLCFDANAAAEIEERTEFNMLRGEIWQKLSLKNLRVMLWACLLANHPEYDTEESGHRTDDGLKVVGSYIGLGNTPEITEAVEKAFIASLPKEKREAIESERKKREQSPFAAAPPSEAGTPNPPGSTSGPEPASNSESAPTNSAA